MGLDIRWPIGFMFSFIGALLAAYGVCDAADSQSLGININLVWGLVLIVFDAAMLLGASRANQKLRKERQSSAERWETPQVTPP